MSDARPADVLQRYADESYEALGRRAEAGEAQARTTLGARLLTGRNAPFSPALGVKALTEAVSEGDPDAPALVATLYAMGAGVPQSWRKALDLVALSAERGAIAAQRQLELLAAGPSGALILERGSGDWTARAAMVDVPAWLTPPPKRPLCERPRIRTVEGFVPSSVCRWLISVGEGRVRPALVYDSASGGGRVEAARSNSALELSIIDLDLVTAVVRQRISAIAGPPVMAMEPPQILHYRLGEKFDLHYDFLDGGQPGFARDVALRGQRIITVLIYLNSDYEGGETVFPKAKVSVKGGAGEALLFANVAADGRPDPLTLHAGSAPTAGEKWVFSQWIRDRMPAPVS